MNESEDRLYLSQYAGLALAVADILSDRESLPKDTPIYTIIRANLDAVYDIIGRDIDQIESFIETGEWTP